MSIYALFHLVIHIFTDLYCAYPLEKIDLLTVELD